MEQPTVCLTKGRTPVGQTTLLQKQEGLLQPSDATGTCPAAQGMFCCCEPVTWEALQECVTAPASPGSRFI